MITRDDAAVLALVRVGARLALGLQLGARRRARPDRLARERAEIAEAAAAPAEEQERDEHDDPDEAAAAER